MKLYNLNGCISTESALKSLCRLVVQCVSLGDLWFKVWKFPYSVLQFPSVKKLYKSDAPRYRPCLTVCKNSYQPNCGNGSHICKALSLSYTVFGITM